MILEQVLYLKITKNCYFLRISVAVHNIISMVIKGRPWKTKTITPVFELGTTK
jgi:hypothetical protein